MAKVIASEVSAMTSSSDVQNLSKMESFCKSMAGLIDDFVSDSPSVLKGGGYDMVRTKLNIDTNLPPKAYL